MEDGILKHRFVPKHEILKDEEKKELLEKYNISLRQLPKIMAKDIIVKSISAKVGDVLKITRKSPTAKESIYYRVVVDE